MIGKKRMDRILIHLSHPHRESAEAPQSLSAAPAATNPSVKPTPAPVTPATTESAAPEPAPVPEKDAETQKAEVIAELEKRKARAIKFGLPTEEVDAKIQRIQKFGLQEESVVSIDALDGELKVGKKNRKEGKTAEKNGNGQASGKPAKNAEKVSIFSRPVKVELKLILSFRRLCRNLLLHHLLLLWIRLKKRRSVNVLNGSVL